MSLYEIDIHRNDYSKPVDIQAVYAALKAKNVSFDKEERRPNLHGSDPYESDVLPEYVYVEAGDVADAVGIINKLGYTTDEDYVLDEDYE